MICNLWYKKWKSKIFYFIFAKQISSFIRILKHRMDSLSELHFSCVHWVAQEVQIFRFINELQYLIGFNKHTSPHTKDKIIPSFAVAFHAATIFSYKYQQLLLHVPTVLPFAVQFFADQFLVNQQAISAAYSTI